MWRLRCAKSFSILGFGKSIIVHAVAVIVLFLQQDISTSAQQVIPVLGLSLPFHGIWVVFIVLVVMLKKLLRSQESLTKAGATHDILQMEALPQKQQEVEKGLPRHVPVQLGVRGHEVVNMMIL